MRISTRSTLPVLAVAAAAGLAPGLALAQEEEDNERKFRYEPRPAVAGSPVTFTARKGVCGEGVRCEWSFGDGGRGDGRSTTHTFAEHGKYRVTITATPPADPETGAPTGDPTVHESKIHVRRAPKPAPEEPVEPPPPPPPASPTEPTPPPTTPNPIGGAPGNRAPQPSISVTGSGTRVDFRSTTTDPDGDSLTHRWDFGDGTTSREVSPSHDFARAGEYVVVLQVTDRRGAVAQVTVTVVIQLAGRVVISQPVVTVPAPDSAAAAGTPLLRRLDPFPIVRVTGRILGRSTSVRTLSVRGPRGATVRVTCSRGSCKRPQRLRTRIPRGSGVAGTLRLRRFEKRLRSGTILQIRVTQGDLVGKYTRLRIATGRAPVRTDRCLAPGSSKPVACEG